jgi:hypothetical protein
MPDGSMAVKSAWMVLKGGESNRSRYYHRKAWVRTRAPGSDKAPTCTREEVALIGLHIVQKTLNSPQWIWSSFEHVDNLTNRRPADSPDAIAPFALHDASTDGLATHPVWPMSEPAVPFNVARVYPLHPAAIATNRRYVAALRALKVAGPGDVLWQHYRLVTTQWPRDPRSPQVEGVSFPRLLLNGQAYSYNNPVFETFFQDLTTDAHEENGCFACHRVVRNQSDRLWTPVAHAFASSPTDAAQKVAPLRSLAQQLERLRLAKPIK